MPTKTIFVTGITGNVGSATARHLLKNGFLVKGLTRNASSAKAIQLKDAGAQIIQGNLDDPSSYSHHLKGADGLFCLLTYVNGVKKEVRQGIDMVNEAKKQGINYFLYVSVIGADAGTGIPIWESKNEIEKHLKQSGLNYTIIRPSSFYDNFLFPQVKSRILKGKLVAPLSKDKVQQFICAEDLGKISTTMFMNPEKYKGKTIELGVGEMSQTQVADVFAKSLGKEIRFQQLPGIITRLAMGKNLYTMFKWVNNNDVRFVKDIEACKREFPGMLSLEDWIKSYFR